MNRRKMIFTTLLILLISLSAAVTLSGCGKDEEEKEKVTRPPTKIVLATTNELLDSGLLHEVLPDFEKEKGYLVDVISGEPEEVFEAGKLGRADVLLTDSSAEGSSAFIEQGYADQTGKKRVMYRDFVVLGPKSDPADIEDAAKEDAAAAFEAITTQHKKFVSRADESDTHEKELSIWDEVKITPQKSDYLETKADMKKTIRQTAKEKGYTLSDRTTWLEMKKGLKGLKVVCEKDPSGLLDHPYSVICVNAKKNESVNEKGAKAFRKWILSKNGQKAIQDYGKKKYGESIFFPKKKQEKKKQEDK